MATHSSILAWRIPQSEEFSRLQFMGSQRVGHDLSHLAEPDQSWLHLPPKKDILTWKPGIQMLNATIRNLSKAAPWGCPRVNDPAPCLLQPGHKQACGKGLWANTAFAASESETKMKTPELFNRCSASNNKVL